MKRLIKRTLISAMILITLICIYSTIEAQAFLSKPKSTLLDKLGMASNYNRPEIWEDQLGGYATGGSIYVCKNAII